jgi:sec-independent protein translocase protein TatA
MGDVAQGIKAFKKGMSEDDKVADKSEPKAIDNASAQPAQRTDVGSKAV